MNTYYILTYKAKSNFDSIKKPFQKEHMSLMQKYYKKNLLIMAGGISNPVNGGMLIFKGRDSSIAEDFAINDPYVINGIIEDWHVSPWQVVIE